MGKSKRRSREREEDEDNLRSKVSRVERMFAVFLEQNRELRTDKTGKALRKSVS